MTFEDEFYENITKEQFENLLRQAPKPGKAHTRRNIAKRQYIEYLTESIKQKNLEEVLEDC